MNPWYVLVADTFDSVTAENVSPEGRALECFTCTDLDVGVYVLEVIACGKCSAGTCAGCITSDVLSLDAELFKDLKYGCTGHFIVPEIVFELFELVEYDDVLTAFCIKFMALVEDFFYVGFTARGSDDFACNCLKPVKSFLRHVFWKNSDGLTAKKS